MKRRDLAEWESEFGGITAEGVARRVINKYRPPCEVPNKASGDPRIEQEKSAEGGGADLNMEEAVCEDSIVEPSAGTDLRASNPPSGDAKGKPQESFRSCARCVCVCAFPRKLTCAFSWQESIRRPHRSDKSASGNLATML